jgi:hypothetical protein
MPVNERIHVEEDCDSVTAHDKNEIIRGLRYWHGLHVNRDSCESGQAQDYLEATFTQAGVSCGVCPSLSVRVPHV